MNRLSGADFDKTGYATNAFDCSYGYNANGNFTAINRRKSDGSYIDQLSFGYVGNQIDYIDDSSLDIANVVDYPGALYGTYAFEYDYNGNMSYEPYKEISLEYNLINLPYEADFGSNRKINYFYTFDGIKLRQIVEDNGIITKTDYCGPFVYETVSGVRSLKYLITPEGRAVKSGSTWEYEYNLKDHLGNTRAVIKNNSGLAQLIQERHYYPFGMEMSELSSGTSTNKFLYNSKEHQNDFELDWYDYGARFYDPELGRWHVIDNKAEKYLGLSPYTYTVNNPIRFIDPDGNDIVDAAGNPITYSKKDGWSSNATESTKRIHGSMMRTATGKTQWMKMKSSPNKIMLSISDQTARKDGKLVLGVTSFKSVYNQNEGKKVKKEDQIFNVTIFEGSIKETQKKGGVNEGLSMDQAISATGGHEAEHATNEENIQHVIDNKSLPDFMQTNVESLPNSIGSQIRSEIKQNTPKLLAPRQAVVKLNPEDKL